MTKKITVFPITIKEARMFIQKHHSHHDAPIGALLATSIRNTDNRTVCVGTLGRPAARFSSSTVAEITRIASDGSEKNAASMCIAALSRAAIAIGFNRIISYTILGEKGTSYLAAGWIVTGITKGGDWSCAVRRRRAPLQNGQKVRWEFGQERSSYDEKAFSLLRSAEVEIIPKTENLPLFGGDLEIKTIG